MIYKFCKNKKRKEKEMKISVLITLFWLKTGVTTNTMLELRIDAKCLIIFFSCILFFCFFFCHKALLNSTVDFFINFFLYCLYCTAPLLHRYKKRKMYEKRVNSRFNYKKYIKKKTTNEKKRNHWFCKETYSNYIKSLSEISIM